MFVPSLHITFIRWSAVLWLVSGCSTIEPPHQLSPSLGDSGGGGAAAGGTNGAAGAGAVDPLRCEPPNVALTSATLHQAAYEVLGKRGRSPSGVVGACAFSGCHEQQRAAAMLVLQDIGNLSSLVGRPSCQAPAMALVAAGGGDVALQRSWIWQKLTAPLNAMEGLAPQSAWGTAVSCGGPSPGNPFGGRMPARSASVLPETQLGPIRRWICAGAPGPM